MEMRGLFAALTTTALAVGLPQAAHAAHPDTMAPTVSSMGLRSNYVRATAVADP